MLPRQIKNELFNAVYYLKGDAKKGSTYSELNEGGEFVSDIKTRDQAAVNASRIICDCEDGVRCIDKTRRGGWSIKFKEIKPTIKTAGLVSCYIRKIVSGALIEWIHIKNAEWCLLPTMERLKDIVDVWETALGYKCEVCFVRKRGLEIARNVLTMIIGTRGLSFDLRHPNKKAFMLSMIRCIKVDGMWTFYAINSVAGGFERYIVISSPVGDELIGPCRAYHFGAPAEILFSQEGSELERFLKGEISDGE